MPSEDATAGDVIVQQELAKANLLKVRQEYGPAKDQCLAILRRYPNNVTAKSLLGDICTETGDDVHAVEWFELALDLDPKNLALQRKLLEVKRRQNPEDAALADLGVPGPRPALLSKILFGVALLVIIVAIVTAFRQGKKTGPGTVIRTDVVAGPPPRKGQGPQTDEPSQDTPEQVVTSSIQEDAALLERMVKATADGAALIEAKYDPRTFVLTLSYRADASSARPLGIRIAKDALNGEPQATAVTIRGLQDGKTIYMADVLRQKVQEGAADEQLPTNEWPGTASPQ